MRISRYLTLLAVPFFYSQFASAQSALDVNIGFGAKMAPSSGAAFDTFNNGQLYRATSLDSFFMGLGGKIMLTDKYGVGAEVSFQPHRPDYAGVKIRNTFYDFHGIYQPFSAKRAALQLKGGIGGTNSRFYLSQSGCGGFTGCQNYTQYLVSANHFQVVGGAGVQVYLTDHIFLRPQFDIHYVPNFEQYGRNWVTSTTAWVGYSFGDR